MFADGTDAGRQLAARPREAGVEADLALAVPVCAPDSVDPVARGADEVVCLDPPADFGAVGRHDRDFSQVSDADARAYLDSGPDPDAGSDGGGA